MKNMFKGKSYAPTMRAVEAAEGKETAQRFAEEAFAEYLRTKSMHDIKNRVRNSHWLNCCERAAIYLTLKKYYPKQAYEWVELSVKRVSANSAALINNLMKLPLMKRRFFKIMHKVADRSFGDEGGFTNEWVAFSESEMRFNILDCPYCKYLKELGCPELTPGFCASDVYIYGNLNDFEFERSGTLGTGGEKCDFCFKRR